MSPGRFHVGAASDFPEESITKVMIETTDVIVVKQGGAYFALPDRCTHQRYPLHDGELLDGKIKCIRHGATFDLHSGRATMPAIKKINLFQAEEVDGQVYVTMLN